MLTTDPMTLNAPCLRMYCSMLSCFLLFAARFLMIFSVSNYSRRPIVQTPFTSRLVGSGLMLAPAWPLRRNYVPCGLGVCFGRDRLWRSSGARQRQAIAPIIRRNQPVFGSYRVTTSFVSLLTNFPLAPNRTQWHPPLLFSLPTPPLE